MSDTPTPPAVSEAMREAVVREMAESWDVFVSDTGCFPDDFTILPRRRLQFVAGGWAGMFADALLRPNGPIASEIARLTGERDTWRRVARGAGVCMTCALGAPDTFGCTDCLNTGFEQGAPQGYVPEGYHTETVSRLTARAEAETARLRAALEKLLPNKLLGEIWGLPDADTVQIVVSFGALREARAALTSQEKTDV